MGERNQDPPKPTQPAETPACESHTPLKPLKGQRHKLHQDTHTKNQRTIRENRQRKLQTTRLEVPGNRSSKRTGHTAHGGRPYPILPSIGCGARVERQKSQDRKHPVESQEEIPMHPTHALEESRHDCVRQNSVLFVELRSVEIPIRPATG